MMKRLCLGLWLMLVGLSACAPQPALPTLAPTHIVQVLPTATPVPSATATTTPPPTLHPTRTASSTYTPSQTATTEPCPGVASHVALQVGEAYPALLQEIADYLEQGKPVADLPATFSRKSENSDENRTVRARLAYLTGQSQPDVLVTIETGTPWRTEVGASGAFVFYQCRSGQYASHYFSADPTATARLDMPYVQALPLQLLNTPANQLVVRYGKIGRGDCSHEIFLVAGLAEGAWVTYLQDEIGCEARDIATAERLEVLEPDAAGRRGLRLEGLHLTNWSFVRLASRPVQLFYTWQDNQLQFEKRVFLPSEYRFHALQDAQLALAEGDVTAALQHYQNAATNAGLEDVPSVFEYEGLDLLPNDPTRPMLAHQYQTAFAYFQIIVLTAATGETAAIPALVQQVKTLYPNDQPGAEFAALATIFQAALAQNGDATQACQAANAVLTNTYPTLIGRNGHVGTWGDVGEFTVAALCPVLGEAQDK